MKQTKKERKKQTNKQWNPKQIQKDRNIVKKKS